MTLFLLFLSFISTDVKLTRHPIRGFNFQNDTPPEFFFNTKRQLEFHQDHYFLSTTESGGVNVYDKNFHFLRSIGKKGQGPTEIGFYAIPSFSLWKNEIWIIDSSIKWVKGFNFETGKYIGSIKLKSYIPHSSESGTENFIVEKDYLIVPTVEKNAIAYKYSKNNGTLIDKFSSPDPVNPQILQANPFFYSSSWKKMNDLIYVFFKHQNTVFVLNENLKLKDVFHVDTPLALKYFNLDTEQFLAQPDKVLTTLRMPTVLDVKMYEDHMFLLLPTVLIEMNRHTGKLIAQHGFFGKAEEVGDEAAGLNLVFSSFALVNDHFYLLFEFGFENYEMWEANYSN